MMIKVIRQKLYNNEAIIFEVLSLGYLLKETFDIKIVFKLVYELVHN